MCTSIELDINMAYHKMFESKCYKVKTIICGHSVYLFSMTAIISCIHLPLGGPYVRRIIMAWTTNTCMVAESPPSHCSKIWSWVLDCNKDI